jgi:hypothetical protein
LRGEDNYISSTGYKNIHFAHDGYSLGVANGVLGGKKFSVFDGSAGTIFAAQSLFLNQTLLLRL